MEKIDISKATSWDEIHSTFDEINDIVFTSEKNEVECILVSTRLSIRDYIGASLKKPAIVAINRFIAQYNEFKKDKPNISEESPKFYCIDREYNKGAMKCGTQCDDCKKVSKFLGV